MMWNLPLSVEIDGKKFKIRNKCDYRVVLDVITTLNDTELDMEDRIKCALFQFYGNDTNLNSIEKVLLFIPNHQKAIDEMTKIINLGEECVEQDSKPRIMDWEHDFPQLAPPISRVLGYSVRDESKYTHYYDFVGAYMEIGECTFSNIISIRSKRQKGKKLEDWEQEFYRENKKIVDLPQNLTEEEKEWLDSDW